MNREDLGRTRKPSRWSPLFAADGWVLFLASLASRLYLGVLLSLGLIAILPSVLGWNGTVVQSGSMEPHISAGDVVLTTEFKANQHVPMGGVVQFLSPAAAEPDGVEKFRMHRIVAGNPDGTYVTAGDANRDVDSTALEREQITGQARLLIPYVGLPGLWLASGKFTALTWWLALTLLAVALAVFGHRSSPEEEETESGEDTENDPLAISEDVSSPHAISGSPRLKIGIFLSILAGLIALILATSTSFSAAAFTASTTNASNTFTAAADWNPPTVSIPSPGSVVRGNVVLTAQANDDESGIRSVSLQYRRAGGSWTTLCTADGPPYQCQWDTQSLPDGSYDLRAIATDKSGLTSTSATVQTTVANTFSVVLDEPDESVRGTVNLSATLNSPGSTPYTVRVEYSPEGANKWSTLCQMPAAPYTCSWITTNFSNTAYDLRAVAVTGSSTTYSEPVTDILVDNVAPTVSMIDPGTPLRGTSTFAATATDAHSGVDEVQIQYSRSGSNTWTQLCSIVNAPYSCRFNTASLPSASYNFRAIAKDFAGNSSTSTVITNRIIDNTVSSVSMEDPGAYLSGTVTLNASANSTAKITNVRIQSAPAGTNTWTTRCTVLAEPYSCDWDTTTVGDGLYDFRAILTDDVGKETISTPVASRRVDNTPLRGADIQAVNGSGTQGKIDAGDTLSFTYSQQVNLASVTPGWQGSSLPVTLRLRDGNVQGLGTGNSGDTVDIQRPGSTVNLGSVNTKGNFIKNRKTTTFNATMTAATVTIAGVPKTVITVTLGAPTSGSGSLRVSGKAATMVWTPSSSVTSLSGVASSLIPTNETGTVDKDF